MVGRCVVTRTLACHFNFQIIDPCCPIPWCLPRGKLLRWGGSDRSFQGFVCLMQLSTREQDYIVDPLKLRREMWRLLPVFTDPKIVKVFYLGGRLFHRSIPKSYRVHHALQLNLHVSLPESNASSLVSLVVLFWSLLTMTLDPSRVLR